MKRFLLFGATAVLASQAMAGIDSYVCTVSTFGRLQDDGMLVSVPKDPIMGKQFTVDRTSGKIIGRYLSSTGFKTSVLDSGSNERSFKVLATSSRGFMHVLYLQVQEFQNSGHKPFMLVDASAVYAGTCD